MLISIHLMLLFISVAIHNMQDKYQFQYISCYCLSDRLALLSRPYYYFNTSHVTVYRLCFVVSTFPRFISIHLMLLFIRNAKKVCLRITNFNTSHVTVYRNGFLADDCTHIFQYISCYCLSETSHF